MEIQNLQARVYYLAGMLEEAKTMLQAAVKEVEEAQKKAEPKEAPKNEAA